MNRSEIVTLMQLQSGMPLIAVRYLQDPLMTDDDLPTFDRNGRAVQRPRRKGNMLDVFKNLTAPGLCIGDKVVVDTEEGYRIAEVTVTNVPTNRVDGILASLRHVVCKIDSGHLEYIKAEEGKVLDKLAVSEITSRLQQVRQQYGMDVSGWAAPGLPPPQNAQPAPSVVEPAPAAAETPPWQGGATA